MPTSAKVAAAAPLLLSAVGVLLMGPTAQRLIGWRLKDDPDAGSYAVDLYSMTTLVFVIGVDAIVFAPGAGANVIWIGLAYFITWVVDLVALTRVLTANDYHVFVSTKRFWLWSYATLLTVGMMVIAAVATAVLT